MKTLENRFVKGLVILGMLIVSAVTSNAQYTNGIYAEFNTSMGSYTCRLEYAIAPKTCANFIGLVTGGQSWLDIPSGVTKTNPFYPGTTFHRVIAGFMNQGGSKNALGTDGPGYQFVDEFSPSLRHDSFGVLSMANSGPDSNGAQYFITVSPQPSLNDVHSVFGKVYGGSNVVYAINQAATGANDKPLTNITVNSINIRRVGASAIGFDITTNGLPTVTNLNVKIAKVATNISLTFTNRLDVENKLYFSSTLASWNSTSIGVETSADGLTNSIFFSTTSTQQFFKMAQIKYASTLLPPRSVAGRVITIVFTNGASGTLVTTVNSGGNGSYTYNSSPGAVLFSTYYQDPFNGKLLPIGFSNPLNLDMTLTLNFDRASAGGVSGTVYPAPYYYTPSNPLQYSVRGSFSIAP